MRIDVDATHTVSALSLCPAEAAACLVMAHGAGAGMTHPFLTAVAEGLARLRIATLRYQFPYMEQGSRRPDRPPLAHATVRAAVASAERLMPSLPLFAGGKSFGGRMTSQAQAAAAMPAVRGLVFLGYPLHPANKPSDERALHLSQVRLPMLFLQGTRDALADMRLLAPLLARLGKNAAMIAVDGADHSFHVPARSGRTDAEVLDAMLVDLVTWMRAADV